MEMDNSMISILILLVAIFASRVISEKANKSLSTQQKAELIDLFSKNRIYTFAVLILIIAAFFASLKFNLIEQSTTVIIYVILISGFMVINSNMAYKKLKSNNFPGSYIKSYLISTSIRLIGLMIFFALL